MARLIDDIRAQRRLYPPSFVAPSRTLAWHVHGQSIWPILLMPDLPVIKIDNVADYYFFGSDQESWSVSKDFPNLAPPFKLAWYEYRIPKLIHSREKGDTDLGAIVPRGRTGCLVFGSDRDEISGEGIPPDMRWALTFEFFLDWAGAEIQGPCGSVHLAVDAQGQAIDKPWMQCFCGDELAGIMQALVNWAHPAMLAMSFMHCKNVLIVDEPPIRPLNKKYHAKTGIWPAKVKTLVIEPLKQILRREGGSDKVGLARAMHICRGHFRDYREGKGLFGKIHQLVWMPSTVHGRKKAGEQPPPREIEVKL